jgi:prephenate dehydratase
MAQTGRAVRPKRISIQGYAGAFHEIAARHCFQDEPLEIVPAHTFRELVESVEHGEHSDIGLMAIENTLAGSLMSNYGLLNESKLKITGEVYLRIKQNLLVLPGRKIENLREVHSHPIAIAQCQEFFAQYPHIQLVETADTALSARIVREKQLKHVGAIASTLAADLYELEVLAAGIETNKKNHTRFLVLEREDEITQQPEADKVSLCFSVDHEVGGLYRVLGVLAAYNANLTKIQSAPIIGKPWEYMFFLDFVSEGRLSYEQAIEAVRPLTHDLNVMGVYHKGEHYEY